MKLFFYRYLFLVCTFALILTGCSEPKTSSVKQSKLIAAENMELQKEIERLNAQIEKLMEKHEQELEQKQKLLIESQAEVEALKEISKQNVRDQVQDVVDIVIQQNAMMRQEIEVLKKQLEAQKIQIQQFENMLSAIPEQ